MYQDGTRAESWFDLFAVLYTLGKYSLYYSKHVRLKILANAPQGTS